MESIEKLLYIVAILSIIIKERYTMRNPKRIARILRLIKKIWTKHPNLRLCQLIGNCFPAGDNYYKEDKDLEKRLRETYEIFE